VRLGDDEVDPLLDRPAELLLVLGAHDGAGALGIRRVIAPCVADVAGHQGAALGRDLVGDPDRLAVHGLQVAVPADVAQLVAVRVVGQRHHDVGPRAEELAVELPERARLVEDHLRDVRTGLDVAAPLELEHIALGADDHAVGEALLEGAGGRAAHRPADVRSKRAGAKRSRS
jgi:hypothetical protein